MDPGALGDWGSRLYVHGANRLGSNSLTECAVWGRIVGEEAAVYAMGRPALSTTVVRLEMQKEEERIAKLIKNEHGGMTPLSLRAKLQDLMERGAGIVRHGSVTSEALRRLNKLFDMLKEVRITDGGRIYNMELREVLELYGMLYAAQAVLTGALLRRESRGAHYRLDFPRRDDDWLVHTVYYLYGDTLHVSTTKVEITRWMPETRRY